MEGKKEPRKLTLTSTKQEMLQAYNTLPKELEARQEGALKPEKKIEEKKSREAVPRSWRLLWPGRSRKPPIACLWQRRAGKSS